MYRLFAILIGSAAFWWASGDWSCVLVFVIPAIAAVDFILTPVICGLRDQVTRQRKLARVAVVGCIGLLAGHLMRVTPQWAFQEALRIDPPAGVDVTNIHRHYEGGPGEHTLIVEFNADQQAMQGLLNRVPEVKDGRLFQEWQKDGEDWDAAWSALCGLNVFPFSHWSWRLIPRMTAPVFVDYGFPRYPGGPTYPGEAILLWEPTGNRGVLLQRRF